MPYIAGEDITACVAAAVERKWVTDWITPAYTTTVFRKASDLVLAADLMRKAITNANVIYLDPRTWDEVSGLDMAVSHTWSGSPYNTNTVGTAFLEAPVSTFMKGIALSDMVIPYTYVTNTIVTTNQPSVTYTNLYIVSQTNTVTPNWNDTGRPTGTVFRWGKDEYGVEQYTDDAVGWTPIVLDQWDWGWWSTLYVDTPSYWGTADGSLVGTYHRLDAADPGEVVIAYHNTVTNTPLITTTNYIVTRYGGTNLLLYAHGQPSDMTPDVPRIKPLLGNTNSWWEHNGFSTPYNMNQVETNSRPLYFITTNGLNQLRKLATNMVRTVQFDFPCSNRAVTAQIIGSGMWDAIYIDYSSTFDDFDALWVNAEAAINSGVGLSIITNTLTTLKGTTTGYAANMHIRRTDEFGVTFTNYQHLAGLSFSNRRFEFTVPSIPIEAYTNGFISRQRVYVQYEVTGEMGLPSKDAMLRMDGGWWNIPVTYSNLKTKTDENVEDRFGWDYTFGGTSSFDVPANENDPNATYNVYSLATNRVWVLVADVVSPTTPPSFTLGPSNLVSASYTYPQPKYGLSSIGGFFTYDDHGVRFKGYAASIAHSALVIDWDFKIFGDTDYVPEAYKPAWTTNNIPPWVTNSP
jgi:hypothetical protein